MYFDTKFSGSSRVYIFENMLHCYGLGMCYFLKLRLFNHFIDECLQAKVVITNVANICFGYF